VGDTRKPVKKGTSLKYMTIIVIGLKSGGAWSYYICCLSPLQCNTELLIDKKESGRYQMECNADITWNVIVSLVSIIA